jgi:hypothetical protein
MNNLDVALVTNLLLPGGSRLGNTRSSRHDKARRCGMRLVRFAAVCAMLVAAVVLHASG